MSTHDRSETKYQARRDHIEQLKEKVVQLSGSPDNVFISPDCPDEITEKFLQQVLAFEEREERSLWAPPDLDDGELNTKLWEVIRAMSQLGHYLHNTDHLSDCELYRRLWQETLREPTTMIPENPNFACHIGMISTGSDEGIDLYLTHYADEEAREQWQQDFPDDLIPPHEDPPYDRDRLLPRAP